MLHPTPGSPAQKDLELLRAGPQEAMEMLKELGRLCAETFCGLSVLKGGYKKEKSNFLHRQIVIRQTEIILK